MAGRKKIEKEFRANNEELDAMMEKFVKECYAKGLVGIVAIKEPELTDVSMGIATDPLNFLYMVKKLFKQYDDASEFTSELFATQLAVNLAAIKAGNVDEDTHVMELGRNYKQSVAIIRRCLDTIEKSIEAMERRDSGKTLH
ncbi:MAG: hypothetical protein J5809_08955 [Selenomonadaceae bacterium]|nr:hypothetical protein [Selenomonadaceae bacterium]